jgi:protein-disulfide isomerase
MNEQARNTFLAVGVGMVAGIGLLLGISSIVTNSMLPAVSKIGMLAESQARAERSLEQKIEGLEKKIDSFDQKLGMLALARGGDARPAFPSNAPAQPPAQGGGCGGAGAAGQPPAEDLNKVYMLNVGATPVKGKKEAPVMITMFADFECPFCARFYEPMKEVLNAYPDKVKFMVKNFPLGFHQNAIPGAKAALAAGLQGKYFEMIDVLMKNKSDASEAKLKEYAQAIGLDEKKLLEDLKNKDAEFDKQIKEDMELGSRSDVRGTPTFFLNGKKANARDVNSWKAAIDAALGSK